MKYKIEWWTEHAAGDLHVFEVGKIYRTQAGDYVEVIERSGPPGLAGYETLKCSDGVFRYDRYRNRTDAGRVTGTPHDYSYPGNFDMPESGAPEPVAGTVMVYWGEDAQGRRLYKLNRPGTPMLVAVEGVLHFMTPEGEPFVSTGMTDPRPANEGSL